MKNTSAATESHASPQQLQTRSRLEELFRETPVPAGDLMTNLGLFMRSSALVKILVIDDLYKRILNVPGAILEFGVWWGQNLVLFENLRAIYEPFNKARRIIGFDTFEGYRGFSDKDKKGEVFSESTYAVTRDYVPVLEELMDTHEKNNVLGHVSGGHQLVIGDVSETAKRFLDQNRGMRVALAYFDMGLYAPTKAALEAIKPRLLPGSVILLDEFTWDESPGESEAFREVFSGNFRIEKSALTPLRAIVTIT